MRPNLVVFCGRLNVAMVVVVAAAAAAAAASSAAAADCPGVLVYEADDDPKRSHGTVTVHGDFGDVVVEVVLDRPAVQLGNWFGEVNTSDYKTFAIYKQGYVGRRLEVRFYVVHRIGARPDVVEVRVNGVAVCPPQPLQLRMPPPAGEDDDFYPGDFAFINGSADANADLEAVCGRVTRRSKRQAVSHAYFHRYLTGTDVLQARPRPLILHGTPSMPGAYPWHAAVYVASDFELTYVCGGSLITKRHVLTVAHCVAASRPDDLVIYLGKYRLRRFGNGDVQQRAVVDVDPHPEYDASTFRHDIALLKLDEDVVFTDRVRPVCLWQDGDDIAPLIRKSGTVAGWGYDETGKVADVLMETSMPVVSRDVCVASFPQFYRRYTNKRTFCAGSPNGSSLCNGDSGGGMVFPRRRDADVFQLRGLVSISVALRAKYCDSTHYVVFTDVAKYEDWIASVANVYVGRSKRKKIG